MYTVSAQRPELDPQLCTTHQVYMLAPLIPASHDNTKAPHLEVLPEHVPWSLSLRRRHAELWEKVLPQHAWTSAKAGLNKQELAMVPSSGICSSVKQHWFWLVTRGLAATFLDSLRHSAHFKKSLERQVDHARPHYQLPKDGEDSRGSSLGCLAESSFGFTLGACPCHAGGTSGRTV